ncbi:19441_t:CDS:2, partial [Racocetra fulgida]
VRSINNVKVAKLEINLSKQKIAKNIGDLKMKLSVKLFKRLNSLSAKDLKWYELLASQMTSDKSNLVQNLDETSKNSFMKLFNQMQ